MFAVSIDVRILFGLGQVLWILAIVLVLVLFHTSAKSSLRQVNNLEYIKADMICL